MLQLVVMLTGLMKRNFRIGTDIAAELVPVPMHKRAEDLSVSAKMGLWLKVHCYI